jgi:hypothetical protein
MEHQDIRSSLVIFADGTNDHVVPYVNLGHKNVVHILIEIYSATKNELYEILLKHVINRLGPSGSFSFDEVKTKLTGARYIGVRISFIGLDGVFRTYLLSLMEYKPASSTSHIRASELLLLYVDR